MDSGDLFFYFQAAFAVAAFLVYGAPLLRHERKTGDSRLLHIISVVTAAAMLPMGFVVLYGAIVESAALKILLNKGHRFALMVVGLGVIFHSVSILIRNWPKK